MEIKTRSGLGEGDDLWIYFADLSDIGYAGKIHIDWRASGVYYHLIDCQELATPFPDNVPWRDTDIFRITKILEPYDRIKLHCNGVEVLDAKLSEFCDMSGWHQYWGRDVEIVEFLYSTSEFYRPYQG